MGDEFVLVTKSHKRCRNSQKNYAQSNEIIENGLDSSQIKDKMAEAKTETEEYARNVALKLDSNSIDQIVCYGLGAFSTSTLAQFQLGVLLNLEEKLRLLKRKLIYDPIFTKDEIDFLESQGWTVLKRNDSCCFPIESETLFYMPHCGRPMYNNVLFSNWTPAQLSRISIIGNSFRSISTVAKAEAELSYLRRTAVKAGVLKEFPFPEFQPCFQAFNDTSLLQFTVGSRLEKDVIFWDRSVAPHYDECSIEIIVPRNE